jgi:hypothetical protein
MEAPLGGYDVAAITDELTRLLSDLEVRNAIHAQNRAEWLAGKLRRLLTPSREPVPPHRLVYPVDTFGFDRAKTEALFRSISFIRSHIASGGLPAAVTECRGALEAWGS